MRTSFVSLLVLSSIALTAPALAGNLEVSPTTIEIGEQGGPAAIYITNRDSEPVAVQVQAFSWRQTANGDVLEQGGGIQVSPPLARIAPGKRQIIRLLAPKASTAQRAFRVILSELPDPAAASKASAVRVLLQFSIPVFVGENTAPPHLEWNAVSSGSAPRIVVHNAGLGRAKLADFEIVRADGARAKVKLGSSRYVLAGATREWPFQINDIRVGETLRIDGKDARGGAPLKATVTVAKQ